MTRFSRDTRYQIVDLFAGAGGLSEGFASLRNELGAPVFKNVLAVEKEETTFQTLQLRKFYHQFEPNPPDEYYRYLNGEMIKKDLINAFPEQWATANDGLLQLELGTDEASAIILARLDAVRENTRNEGGDTILIGGPPCQAYSLVGRARNRAISEYNAVKDHRYFLYREYVRILQRLQPAAFLMENVKGILSSRVKGRPVFDNILTELRAAGGLPDSYRLVTLVAGSESGHRKYIVRAEEFGIPQKRHRVFICGIRADIAEKRQINSFPNPSLVPVERQATVSDVLAGLPPLRSGLSKSADGKKEWVDAVVHAFHAAARACRGEGSLLEPVAARLDLLARGYKAGNAVPTRRNDRLVAARHPDLRNWLSGNRTLPHHETRGHMETDLVRFAFAAGFAKHFGTSPKAKDYPKALAPDHVNWTTGKFADRFRVQLWHEPSTTITSHIAKDGYSYIHPDPLQCRSLTVREAARLQTIPDVYYFAGTRTQQYVQVGNAVPPLLAHQIAKVVRDFLG